MRFYGIDRGEFEDRDVTVGGTTTATLDVEVRVDETSSITKREVLLALDLVRQRILSDTNLPA